MISLAIQQFRNRWQRSVAVFIAVILGVAFFSIAFLAGGPLNNSLRAGVGQQIIGSDLVVTASSSSLTDEVLDTVLSSGGVEAADMASFSPAEIRVGGTSTYLLIGDVPTVPDVQENIELIAGTWPQQSGEIVLAENKLDEMALEIGAEVEVHSWSSEEIRVFTIVGVYQSPSGLASGRASAFLDPGDYQQFIPEPYGFGIRVQLSNDQNQDSARESIQQSVGSDYKVWMVNDFIDAEVSEFAGSTISLQAALGAFATIAMVASGIVIVNSFEISLAQRVREIGLLRSVGATNRQIRRLVIVEALLIGIAGSIAGVGLGIGLMEIAGRFFWMNGGSTGLESTPLTLGLPFLLGLFATLVSALGPARRAMGVRPLQAIRQSDAPELTERLSRKRVVAAGLIAFTGAAIMVTAIAFALAGGAQGGIPLMMGIFGGALTFFAVLMSAQVILPIVAHGLGSVATRLFGVTGELASGNLSRNPRRTASSAAALLMGVTLMTMMTVGTSSVRSTIVSEIEDRQPIDLGIRLSPDDNGTIDLDREIARWEGSDGVRELIPIRLEELRFDDMEAEPVVGVDPSAARSVLRSDGLKELSDETVLISEDLSRSSGLESGDQIELGGSNADVLLQVRIAQTGVDEPMVSMNTMVDLVGDGELGGVWIRLDDDASVSGVMDQVRSGLPTSVNLQVGGGASERESMLEVLDMMLLVVVGLLAAAVVIAIVGIGNTLTLSVIERTRESGMLRAMGLKRSQIRRMLALEGVALALVGALVGIILGIAYGFAGALTLFGDTLGVTLSVPWEQIALICLVAIVSGLLASVLPARRALAIKPVEALSDIS